MEKALAEKKYNTIYRYPTASNKYMKDCYKNKESSYLKHFVEKLVTNLYDKNEYVIHIKKSKQALNHGLILKKFHWVIKFNQKYCLKAYFDINNTQKYCWARFLKLMNNALFGKNMEKVRNYRAIKLVTTDRRRTYSVSEVFTENLLAIGTKKTKY